jgi:hypothetical protein
MTESDLVLSVRAGHPDFLDLPWTRPLEEWPEHSSRIEELPRGLSRHPVVFVNYAGALYALKEMPPDFAAREYEVLRQLEELRMPAVSPVAHARTYTAGEQRSVLITRYLDHSLPYHVLFTRSGLAQYRDDLLDAMAGLLVQLHLAGVFWGDCSLSNTLFRRDAGALQAYLVDAETSEVRPQLSPQLREHELDVMEENVYGALVDLSAMGVLPVEYPVVQTGPYIRQRYHALWDEITREVVLAPGDHFRIQERVRALNSLGFSVDEVQLVTVDGWERLRMRAFVTDRNFHRDLLQNLTGLVAEEQQARLMVNEIQELRATISETHNRSVPLSVAAHRWLNQLYVPTVERLRPVMTAEIQPSQLYCQLLEHKWYLSERAKRDVGHAAAVDDYLRQFSNPPTS